MKTFIKYNLPSFLWAAVIMYLCMVSSNRLPKINIPQIDKMVHFTLYFILAALMYLGWKKQNRFPALHRNTIFKILAITWTYGLAIEVMQETLTTTRHFEWLDEAANAFGSTAGCFFSVKFFK